MVLRSERSIKGRSFQIQGPTTKKARFCLVEMWAKETWRTPCSIERREWELRALKSGGSQSLTRYAGARPSKQHQTNAAILYSIIYLMVVNWNWHRNWNAQDVSRGWNSETEMKKLPAFRLQMLLSQLCYFWCENWRLPNNGWNNFEMLLLSYLVWTDDGQ